MHGWCSDSNHWKCWADAFQQHGWYWTNAERGYTNKKAFEPKWTEGTNKQTSSKKALICHSLGIHLISKELIKEATHIVLINSFGRFIPIGKENRVIKVGLQGMQRQLKAKQEKKMMYLFWEKASFPHRLEAVNPSIVNKELSSKSIEKLQADLHLLINTEKLPAETYKKNKILIIDGEKDKIVIPIVRNQLLNELKQQLAKSPEYWLVKGEGHEILLQKIIEQTRNWLEST